MSKDWKMVKLGDILQSQPKSKIKARTGLSKGLYKFFTSSNIQNKFIDNYTYNKPALIFGTGGNASIHYCYELFATSTDCLVFYGKENINIKSVYQYINGNMHLLEVGFKGAGLKHISKEYILNIEINLPSIVRQHHIAATLDKASELIALRKKQLEELDVLAESVFYDMFGDPVKNEKGWEIKKLDTVIDILSDYHANGSYEILRRYVKLLSFGYALMVRTTDLENNEFINGCNYIDEKAYNFLEKSKIFGGEIIINKIGSAGKVYLMPNLDKPVSLGMNAFLLRFKSELANNIYLFYLLRSPYGEKIIKENVKGAVTKTITKDAVRNLKVSLPPLPLQNRFATTIEKIEKQKTQVKKALQESEDLFQRLMQDLFRPN